MTHKIKNNWVQAGDEFFVRSIAQNIPALQPAVYTIKMNPMTKELYLEKLRDRFEFPFKVYGIEQSFIDRVVKTYQALNTNLGVLLNGIKGTGKTVTAELICNKLNLPTVLVTEEYPGLVPFMNEFNQEVVFFMDEYEKVFRGEGRNEGSYKLLSIMDGCLNTTNRKVFILTTNNLYIDDNLIQRPGRIRYKKTFGNLDASAILDILEDKLERKEFHKDLFKLISQLEIVTVDIVSSLISEVNIHGENPETFFPVFNLEKINTKKDVYVVIADPETGAIQEKLVGLNMEVFPDSFDTSSLGDDVQINGSYIGDVHEVLDNGNIVIRANGRHNLRCNDEPVEVPSKPTPVDPDLPRLDERKLVTYRFAAVPNYRSSMKKYLV